VNSAVNIVALETATETVGVAVRTVTGVQAEFSLAGRRRHVESLTPALTHLLSQVDLKPGDIGVVAVDLGPGLFTGLRVGVSTAKGLAQALGIGIIGLSSLDVLIGAAAGLGHRGLVLSVVDARRGEVFAALGDVSTADGPAVEILPPGLFAPDALAGALAELGGRPVVAVGDGAQRYADVLGAVAGVTCVTGALGAPPASTLLELALGLIERGATPMPPQEVVPLYMREADARSNFAQVGRPAARSSVGPG
jgi:tRNA threonylcarbamoyladenosine biosynthesis protein TsaB